MRHGMEGNMARKNSRSNDKPMKSTAEDEKHIEVPNVNDLTEDDFKKRGPSQSHKLSVAAISVLKAVKNELKGSGENLNDFISEAIIDYSNSRFSEEVLGEVVTSHNAKPMRPSERNRISALERLIAVIGIDFLENEKRTAFNKMKKFLENNPDIFEAGSLQGSCKRASEEANLFTDSEDMPLWLILLYAKKFKYI